MNCLKRNILIVLMINVNFMSFSSGMAPINDGFKKCYTQLQNAFLIYRKDDFIAPDSPLQCVTSAIMYLSANDNLGSELRDYYNSFSGQVDGGKIKNRKTFCAEVTDEHSELTAQFRPVNFWYKIFQAKTSKDKNEQIEECFRELAVFGSSNDEILESALRKYRLSFIEEKLDHVFSVGNFGFLYLIYISEVVTLNDDSNLVTPWDYCNDRHPDKEQENVKPVDQVSTSHQEIN